MKTTRLRLSFPHWIIVILEIFSMNIVSESMQKKNWTSTQLGINQITYNHLNSGKYTFEIRACENGQYTPVKVIRIDIAAPWWRSSLAYVCYALILLAVAFQIYLSVRRRHQKEMNEERIKLFINLA